MNNLKNKDLIEYMSNEFYQAKNGISASQLISFITKPHTINCNLTTASMSLGTLLHKIIIERYAIEDLCQVIPNGCKKSPFIAGVVDNYGNHNPELSIINQSKYEKFKAMLETFDQQLPKLAERLEAYRLKRETDIEEPEVQGVYVETSFFYHDLKARPDIYCQKANMIMDYKTTSNFNHKTFDSNYWNSLQFLQQFHHASVVSKVLKAKIDQAVLIVQETEQPYTCYEYSVDLTNTKARELYEICLEKYKKYLYSEKQHKEEYLNVKRRFTARVPEQLNIAAIEAII